MEIDMTQPGAFALASNRLCCIDPSNFDETVSACKSFYHYANGNWLKNNPIPEIYPAWGSFTILRDVNEEKCFDIVKSETFTPKDQTNVEQTAKMFNLVRNFYVAAMNEEQIETLGSSVLSPIIAEIDQLPEDFTSSQITTLLSSLHKNYGIPSLFSFYSSPDKKESTQTIGSISQGGLGLPDKDYYTDVDEAKVKIREQYLLHIEKMLLLLKKKDAKEAAQRIYDFEFELASSHLTKIESRDPETTYNVFNTLDELSKHAPFIEWNEYFASLLECDVTVVGERLGKLNVSHTKALAKVSELLKSTKSEMLKEYFLWKTVNEFAGHMASDFVAQDFEFFQTNLAGTKLQKPRWKRVMSMIEGNGLGDALGQLYVDHHFSSESKKVALEITENVRAALEERLNEVEWMKNETRAAALEKMKRFAIQIGYPDEWPSFIYFETDKITSSNHVDNIIAGHRFEFKRDMARINEQTDKKRWLMSPQTVNAYYHPILQSPFFEKTADFAVNYGGFGAVVAHEMTHGFDDKGCMFNADGNMVNWWSEEDKANFDKRVEVMVRQGDQHKVNGLNMKGKLTAGENLADLGGVKLSLRALKKQLTGDEPLIDGFTAIQRFFLSWSTIWRQNTTEARAAQLLTVDPHAANEFRSNCSLKNMPEFYEAFGVKETDEMFIKESDRVDIW